MANIGLRLFTGSVLLHGNAPVGCGLFSILSLSTQQLPWPVLSRHTRVLELLKIVKIVLHKHHTTKDNTKGDALSETAGLSPSSPSSIALTSSCKHQHTQAASACSSVWKIQCNSTGNWLKTTEASEPPPALQLWCVRTSICPLISWTATANPPASQPSQVMCTNCLHPAPNHTGGCFLTTEAGHTRGL